MCGIAGYVTIDQSKPSTFLLQKMTDAIAYRGPDDQGQEVIGVCGLGSRRLAIIDLSANGHMPMWTSDRKFCITFNGEIYNFQKHRVALQQKGYKFFSGSDTEVILNMYREYGSKFVSKLKGMFAFAIWDVEKQELFFARDQFGVKPLYYYLSDKVFIFSSELKPILLHPSVKREINPSALSHYFSLGVGCVGSPESIFKQIYKLKPGEWGSLKNGELQISTYWDLGAVAVTVDGTASDSVETAAERVRELLEESVKSQLISDVPLGTFLSGGIDSSLITAFAQKHTSHRLQTFSIGFDVDKFDESRYAKQIAEYFQTDHHHHTFAAKEVVDILPKVVANLDEPFADASILPTYLLAEFTRRHVTVSLSGDGGDEMFAGYPNYLAEKIGQPFRYLPRSIINLIKQAALVSPNLLNLFSFAKHLETYDNKFKIERFFNYLNKDLATQHLDYFGPINHREKSLLVRDYVETAIPYAQDIFDPISKLSLQKQLQIYDFKVFLGEDCLVKSDRASSYNSLESRVPFLDVDLVEYAFSLPSSYHLHGVTLKHLLKKAAVGILPPEIINRKKRGFGIPTHQFLRTTLREPMQDLLNKKRIREQGLFDADFVDRLVKEHLSEAVDHRMVLWNLFMFQYWWDRWMR